MKKLLVIIALFLVNNSSAQSILTDPVNHIYLDKQSGLQYKNCFGIPIPCYEQGGIVVLADRLYINNVQLDLVNMTATYDWKIMFPEYVDSTTVNYHMLLGNSATIPITPTDVIKNAIPSLYLYTAYRLPLIYGRIKLSLQLTEQ